MSFCPLLEEVVLLSYSFQMSREFLFLWMTLVSCFTQYFIDFKHKMKFQIFKKLYVSPTNPCPYF